MGTIQRQGTVRSSRHLARLAAAITGLTARSVAAEGPTGAAPIEEAPRGNEVHSSFQSWVGFTAAGAIRDPLITFVDLGAGFYSDMHPTALVVRPALGLQLPYGFSVFLGYSYSPFWTDRHERGEEHVVFQQIGFLAPFSVADIIGRVRWEERIRPGSEVGYRLRTMVQLNVPLWHKAPLRLEVWDEMYLALNQPADWQPTVLDQDLFFTGLGWTPDAHLLLELGYMGALAPRADETVLVHMLSMGTTVSW